ncbi:glycosyl transferase family 90-domain-containing protein [Chytriomyces cf. hyalinus JEL632]|nr:glycosyl transferase family 90-domain-containing protein [Chytriomyces cf. hyalinus JEL632]
MRKWSIIACAISLLLLVAITLNVYNLTTGIVNRKPLSIAQEYKYHFKKAPPPHFALWTEYATELGCLTNPSEYAQIAKDLSPWFKSIHRRPFTNDSVSHIYKTNLVDFQDGVFHNTDDGNLRFILEPLTPLFAAHGKRFRFAVNAYDEPRMVLADKGFTGEYTNMADVFTHSGCLSKTYDTVKKDKKQKDGHHLLFGNSTARSQHGFFLDPATFGVENARVPVFSQAKVDCFADVLIPLNYHVALGYEDVVDVVSWEDKKSVLFWRGTTTGGSYKTDAPWKQYGRTRVMDWEKRWAAKHPGSTFDAAYESPKLAKGVNVDIGFSGIVQADLDSLALINATYGLKGSVDFEQTKHFKYLLVLDGNTWPSRLQTYLQTNSVILYNGIFTDFYNWKLVPWVHYVPVKLDFSDLDERLEWLMAHDEEAKKITQNAQKLMIQWSNMKQMQCYTGLALLEYSTLYEDEGGEGK